MKRIEGVFLKEWFFEGNICEQCKGYDGCPKFDCNLFEKAKKMTDKQWQRLGEKYVYKKEENCTTILYVDDVANLWKDLRKN